MLSDICALFLRHKNKENHVTRKLAFYAGRALILPAQVLQMLAVEVHVRAERERSHGSILPLEADQKRRADADFMSTTVRGPLVQEIEGM